MIKVDLTTLECVNEPMPVELMGLHQESLLNLDWTDESLGYHGFGWWPEQKSVPNYDADTQRLVGWTYKADAKRKVVVATPVIEDLPADVAAANVQRKLDDMRQQKLATVNTRCDELLTRLKAGYPDGEVVSWDQQVIEARALDVSPTAVTPLLSAIAAQRGIDVNTLAVRVLEKATAYAVASGSIIGARQKLEDAIAAATTVEELSDIDVYAGWHV